MKFIRRSVNALAVLWLAAGANAYANDAPALSKAWLTQLAQAMRAEHQQPALAVAIVRGGEAPVSSVVGLRQHDELTLAQPDDRFHFGSCTKAMTATIIGMLVQDGLLEFDDRVLKFFPEVAASCHEAYGSITVRDLLSHRSGVVAATAGLSPESRALSQLSGTPREQREAAVGVVLGFEPVAPPQTQTRYSNAAFGIAAAIAERVTDTPWEQLMHNRLFTPLKMRRAGLGWPATQQRPDEPRGHFARGDQLAAMPLNSPYAMRPAIAPASDAHGSIDDLARFAAMHLNALRGRESLLSHSIAEVLHAPVADDDPSALGWVQLKLSGETVSWHNGSVGTFFAWMTVCAELDLAVVVATNAGNGEPACRAVTEAVLRAAGEAKQQP